MLLLSSQVHQHLPIYSTGIREFQTQLQHLQIQQAKLAETLTHDKGYCGGAVLFFHYNLLLRIYVCCLKFLFIYLLHSCQKMQMLLEKITAIHQQYRKDRHTGSMKAFIAAHFLSQFILGFTRFF